MDNKILLTATEAAEALGISRSKLYSDLMNRADFPVVRLGGCVRVNRELLQVWVNERSGAAQ